MPHILNQNSRVSSFDCKTCLPFATPDIRVGRERSTAGRDKPLLFRVY